MYDGILTRLTKTGKVVTTIIIVAILIFVLHNEESASTALLPYLPLLPTSHTASKESIARLSWLRERMALSEKTWRKSVEERAEMASQHPDNPTIPFFPTDFLRYPYTIWDFFPATVRNGYVRTAWETYTDFVHQRSVDLPTRLSTRWSPRRRREMGLRHEHLRISSCTDLPFHREHGSPRRIYCSCCRRWPCHLLLWNQRRIVFRSRNARARTQRSHMGIRLQRRWLGTADLAVCATPHVLQESRAGQRG
jgi:hypothetical protein